jgi:membrane protein DedA with SNARE-associated domain
MNDFLSLIMHHGYLMICLVVFAEAIGVPVPGAIALVAGGAAAAAGTLRAPAVVMFAVVAMLSADTLLYVLGSDFCAEFLVIRKRAHCARRNRFLNEAELLYCSANSCRVSVH